MGCSSGVVSVDAVLIDGCGVASGVVVWCLVLLFVCDCIASIACGFGR